MATNGLTAYKVAKGAGLSSSGVEKFLKIPDRDLSLDSRKKITVWIKTEAEYSDLKNRKRKAMKKITKIIDDLFLPI